ncbi:hypothetical protein C8A00DRAFT_42016 [Chaetomidium leptoderma]|uniref:Uncharacterized protein n=1 Tax=Chaetomidium leptoderma TaxID=669021 RepID=A0AAN6VPH2_9PEZI|nr:hypothetical protein C8A00DRAFT_42016 [Chaetomidium leptoderma]
MPSATPQPQLRKKASLRDRLKAWQKPAPQRLEIVTEESKPRFVYEPKHAAADFSRLAVSPLSPSRQRLPPAMQGPAEDGTPTVPRAAQRRPRNYDGHRRAPRDEDPRMQRSRSGAKRNSYPMAEDSFQAANAAAHVPVNSQPVAWDQAVQSVAREEDQPISSVEQPPSDYEVFIAHAEARDRERREKVFRSISQRSAAHSANRIKPDPHRQFAGAAPSSAERSDTSKPRNGGGRYALDSGGAEQRQPQSREQKPAPKRHARQSSWAPSYATSSTAAENVLERKKSPVAQPQPQPQQQHRPPEPVPSQAQPVVYGVDGDFDGAREYRPQPLRTLRKQASLSQRIVQYIRPPKSGVRLGETLVE